MFQHILAPLDGSTLAECVLPHVVALGRALDARITLLRVLAQQDDMDNDRPVDPLSWAIRKVEAQAYLTEWTTRLREIGLTVDSTIREGSVAAQIIDSVHSPDVDLIALSSHGYNGLSNWNLSSVAQKVLQHTRRSALLVRAHQPAETDLTGLHYRRLMLPLDGSQRAEYILPLAQRLAQYFHSRLLLAHVVSQPEIRWRGLSAPGDIQLAQQLIERNQAAGTIYLEEIQRRLPVDCETRLVVGKEGMDALHQLTDRESIDLTILAAHGHSGSPRHPFGSVATNCIDYGNTSLLVVQDFALDHINPAEVESALREDNQRATLSRPGVAPNWWVRS